VAKPHERLNLQSCTVLLLEPNGLGMDVLVQILMGFGVSRFLRASTCAEAQQHARTATVDLIICEGGFSQPGPDGYDFVHWLRRSELDPNAFAPVLMATAHTSLRDVSRARDCGASFIVAKPLIPTVLIDRILWLAREQRPYVTADSYVGPDRRFKNEGPPPGMEGRRSTDGSIEVSATGGPNLSQDEVDNFMQPRRVRL